MASSHPVERRTFPPFPKPPPGVHIIPFSEFDETEWGIRAYNEDDSIEVDAQGVETVALSASHAIDRCKSNRKEKKAFQAVQPDNRPAPQDTNKTRLDWWDVWLKDSHTKFANVDPNLPIEEKITRASEQFHSWRKLGANADSHSPSYIWDKFRYFSGLLSQERKADNTTKKPEPAYDDDDVDPAIDEMVPEAPANEKLDLFVKDMELSIKVFLGQWLQDNGQHVWAGNLKTYPWMVYFFLDFIKRSRIFKDKEEENLDRALTVVEHAKKELPLTHAIAQIAPDNWSLALEHLWGSKVPPLQWADHEDSMKNRMSEIWESGKQWDAAKRADAQDSNTGQAATGESSDGGVGAQASQNDGWGDGGWGNTNGWDNGGEGDWGGGEANPEPEGAADYTGWEVERPSIMSWLGPTALPNTHTTGIVEQSVRKVVKVIPAGQDIVGERGYGAPAVEQQLQNHFTRVIMAPWYADKKVPRHNLLTVPEIKSTSVGPIVGGDAMDVDASMAHDPTKDHIILLIEPQHTELFQNAIGMGIQSIWTQIARVEDVKAGRVYGPTGHFFAYAEQLTSLYPSFHISRSQTVGEMELV